MLIQLILLYLQLGIKNNSYLLLTGYCWKPVKTSKQTIKLTLSLPHYTMLESWVIIISLPRSLFGARKGSTSLKSQYIPPCMFAKTFSQMKQFSFWLAFVCSRYADDAISITYVIYLPRAWGNEVLMLLRASACVPLMKESWKRRCTTQAASVVN